MRDFQSGGRSMVYAERGMAATAHPLASLAAIDTLRAGGSAVDAAIAAVALLCVIEPAMTGIGGDCFALVSENGETPQGFNGSGHAPAGLSPELLAQNGIGELAPTSPHSVTVPGAVAAWDALHERYGRLPFADLLAPAERTARNGFIVAPRVAFDWAAQAPKIAAHDGGAAHYLPEGRAPLPGERHRLPALAETLATLRREGPRAFYEGPIAEDIVATLAALGGHMLESDLAAVRTDAMTPITASYRGREIVELPPNTQGLMALLILKILEGFELDRLDPFGPERTHLEMEAARLAYACRDAVIADPRQARGVAEAVLSDAFVEELRAMIDPARAGAPRASLSPFSNTTYVTVVDENRMAVSFINSLFQPFGSGITTHETGILLQNRGMGFTLEEGHPNRLAPGKRPMHTLLPGMMMADGRVGMSFGVMGGAYQACGHARLISNLYDYDMELQAAIEAPRSFWQGLRAHQFSTLELEKGYSEATAARLAEMGHAITRADSPIGGSQAIRIDWESGVLIGGSDPRKDGCALGY